MPAIRAIYFSPLRTTIAHAKKRASIDKKRSNIKSVGARHRAARVIGNKPDSLIAALSLALFVPWIGRANDVDDAAAPHDLAIFANLLH
jgi:hypothetical protein